MPIAYRPPCVRSLAAGVGALALMVLLGSQARGASCPNYSYPGTCDQDGACIWHRLAAETNNDGVLAQDIVLPFSTADDPPLLVMEGASQGGGNPFSDVSVAQEVEQSSVRASATGDAAGSCCVPARTGFSDGRAITVLRVSDLVFSGPGPDVDTTLLLTFDGSLAQSAASVDSGSSNSTVTALIGGSICGAQAQYMDFSGERTVVQSDNPSTGPQRVVSVKIGILEDVILDATTNLMVGPFTAPTGVPLNFELWAEIDIGQSSSGGSAGTDADFTLHAGAPGGGLVFDLPAGYTADSVEAGIVDSVSAPEPAVALLAVVAGLGLVVRWRFGA